MNFDIFETMAMCKPKIIDLTKHYDASGNTISDKLLTMIMSSLQANGAVEHSLVTGINSLHKALKNEKTACVKCNVQGIDAYYPISISSSSGRCIQFNAVFTAYLNSVLFDASFAVVFYSADDEQAEIFITAKPVYVLQ